MQALDAVLAARARRVAERIARGGARAWIVGGAVRDLATARAAKDVDMTSAATPDQIESWFERTIPLGREFGTLVIHLDGGNIEHTTFRSDSDYADQRRPDEVRFGHSVEEDAARRDFTCNALYLDPLDDTVADPCGGLRDLAERRLRCVGDPRRRFAEDGLRLVRFARFAGTLALEPDAGAIEAARACRDVLRAVARERVALELDAVFRQAGAAEFLRVLDRCDTLDVALPGVGAVRPAGIDPRAWLGERARLLEAIGPEPGSDLGLAALLAPDLETEFDTYVKASRALLEALKPSRARREHVFETWRLAAAMLGERSPARSTRVRWMRRETFATALALAVAWTRTRASGADARLAALAAERDELGPQGLEATAFVGAADLAERGVAPGPRFGALLHEAETCALDREFTTRAEALAWLDRRVQDGGNTARNPRASG